MCSLESPTLHPSSDTPFRAALAADQETVLAARRLTLTDAERELVEHLRPLLALPAELLLQWLLDDGPAPQPYLGRGY